MAFENIEQRLKKALTVKVSFPAGTIWLPGSFLSIDDWLTSIAQTDEELRELNLPRIAFLQNRWPVERLIELEWDNGFSDRRAILAMYVRQRAYILFSGWNDYQVVAAVEPKSKPSLYRELLHRILKNPHYVPHRPSQVHNYRPDLLPDEAATSIGTPAPEAGNWTLAGPHESSQTAVRLDARKPKAKPYHAWRTFMTEILVGWIGRWLDLPEIGFPHEDAPHTISSADRQVAKKSKGERQTSSKPRTK